jgi:hypothetical protein
MKNGHDSTIFILSIFMPIRDNILIILPNGGIMERKKEQGAIILIIAIAAIVALVAGVGCNETYTGDLADLLIDESELPGNYVAGDTTPGEGWTFVPANDAGNDLSEDGWTFVPANDCDDSYFAPAMPLEYEAAVFWYLNDEGVAEISIIQVVARYSAEDIDTMFGATEWAFVPASGLEAIEDDDDARAKIISYHEGAPNRAISLLVTKKDIVINYVYGSCVDFDPEIIFSLASDVIQEI